MSRFVAVLFCAVALCSAQRTTGFGIIFGDPTGLTLKHWVSGSEAIAASIGVASFGSPRIGVDYLWHFDAFRSSVVLLYADFGGAIGFGKRIKYWKDYEYRSDLRLGIRGMFGVNIIPRRTPLEFFLEVGPLIGLVPEFGAGIEVGLGMRFYP